MKYFLLLSLLLSNLCVSAQQSGSVTPKQNFPKAGNENNYVYIPPKGLLIPESAKVQVIYINKRYVIKKILLKKDNENYEFSLKAPDSTQVFIVSIIDGDGKMLDNNSDQGYVSLLFDINNKIFPLTDAITAELLNGIAASFFKLKVSLNDILLLYENEFKINESAKEKYYNNYLLLLYKDKKDEAKPLLVEYAKSLLQTADELKWFNASNIYRVLKMNDEQQKVIERIKISFPNGQIAMQSAYNDLRLAKEPEQKVAKMDSFYTRFRDTTSSIRDNLYNIIITAYAEKKDWVNFYKYSALVSDQNKLNNLYNSVAWKLSGESFEKPGEELETAKNISAQSLIAVKNIISNKAKYDTYYMFFDQEFEEGMNKTYAMYADTYALILFKLKNYDSAFYYESFAIKNIENPSADELERYSVYAEKSKGEKFIKSFLEEQIAKGKWTPNMGEQLKAIYEKLNLPVNDYNELVAKSSEILKEKLAREIKEKMQNYKATDFSLKNLTGENISLSSLKGKVVIVDFWATWCGPCKASFPAMQMLLNKYKDINDVIFVFVDTWENKEPAKMKDEAEQFINDNKYSFVVVLDEKDKTVTDYKVQGIPTKFVIDKIGNVKYISIGFNGKNEDLIDELTNMIESAKKL